MNSIAAVLAAVVGAASESLHHQGGEPRQNDRAATAAEPGVVGSDNRAPGPPVREEVV